MLLSAALNAIINKYHIEESHPLGDSYGEIIASNYDYDDRYDNQRQEEDYGRKQKRYSPRESSLGTLGGLLKNQKQLGAGLLGIGVLLTVMGMMLFFEGTLLRLGNISIIAGIPLLVGVDRVRGFFVKESRIQASTITAIGILLVFWGKPRLGILFEIFGLLNLFGNMFPLLIALGRRLPIIGDIIAAFDSKSNEKGGKKTRQARQPQATPRAQKRYTPDF